MDEVPRVLGLDIGTRRIGVALSDAMGWTGMPLESVEVGRRGEHLARLVALCAEHAVAEIVVGLPLGMDGRENRMVQVVRRMAGQLASRTGLPVQEWDERLTSVAAERVLQQADVRGKARREVVDRVAASLILQGYLEHRRAKA
jgi:putative Holliday junction resolvase